LRSNRRCSCFCVLAIPTERRLRAALLLQFTVHSSQFTVHSSQCGANSRCACGAEPGLAGMADLDADAEFRWKRFRGMWREWGYAPHLAGGNGRRIGKKGQKQCHLSVFKHVFGARTTLLAQKTAFFVHMVAKRADLWCYDRTFGREGNGERGTGTGTKGLRDLGTKGRRD